MKGCSMAASEQLTIMDGTDVPSHMRSGDCEATA